MVYCINKVKRFFICISLFYLFILKCTVILTCFWLAYLSEFDCVRLVLPRIYAEAR